MKDEVVDDETIATLITDVAINGEKPELLYDIIDGKPAGTLFSAK